MPETVLRMLFHGAAQAPATLREHKACRFVQVFCNGEEVLTVSGTKEKYVVDVWSGNHPFYLVRPWPRPGQTECLQTVRLGQVSKQLCQSLRTVSKPCVEAATPSYGAPVTQALHNPCLGALSTLLPICDM